MSAEGRRGSTGERVGVAPWGQGESRREAEYKINPWQEDEKERFLGKDRHRFLQRQVTGTGFYGVGQEEEHENTTWGLPEVVGREARELAHSGAHC